MPEPTKGSNQNPQINQNQHRELTVLSRRHTNNKGNQSPRATFIWHASKYKVAFINSTQDYAMYKVFLGVKVFPSVSVETTLVIKPFS